MDWNRVSGLWTEYKGVAKANWGRLSDNDMTAISGSRDLLIGKLQTCDGLTKDQAEQQVDNWVATLAFTATKPFMQAADTCLAQHVMLPMRLPTGLTSRSAKTRR